MGKGIHIDIYDVIFPPPLIQVTYKIVNFVLNDRLHDSLLYKKSSYSNKANPDMILQNVQCSYSYVDDACAVGCLLLKN